MNAKTDKPPAGQWSAVESLTVNAVLTDSNELRHFVFVVSSHKRTLVR